MTRTLPRREPSPARPLNLADIEGRATITVGEAAQVVGLSRPAAYAAAHRGEIPILRMGKRMLVPVPALLALLREGDRA